MKKVTIEFFGSDSEKVAQKFFTYVVDGGLEDTIIDTLSDDEVKVIGIADLNEDELSILFQCRTKDEQ